jgi:hypothetical protein
MFEVLFRERLKLPPKGKGSPLEADTGSFKNNSVVVLHGYVITNSHYMRIKKV